ncbi:hypothetical protein KCM76_21840 [Zooshikella marina]|uniref:hypothetical protein n=1 Tax=Zooshikella ganghwensis TaxID=202772 RepID=UPI001BAF5623|nr:hypothetical protein [Zooshikella ganghwensis]MBU2708650.1 hypothetical protein [Zooshikella ganghwensis]
MLRQLLLSTVLIMAGCGTTPIAYTPQDSYALNIVRAAGIDAKLKDTELPEDTVTDITDSSGFGFAMAASGYNAPIPGFSPSQMAGMNFAAWLLAPEADLARNSLIAWMPESVARNSPKEVLADLLLDAASQGVRDLGFTPVQEIAKGGTDKTGIGIYVTGRNDGICQDNQFGKSNCWISFAIRDAELNTPPPFVGEGQSKTWFFDPSANVYSRFVFSKNHPGFNELELLLATSKHLPEWIYFYVAPNKVFVGKEQPIKVPLLVQQGQIHYFVKATSSAEQ